MIIVLYFKLGHILLNQLLIYIGKFNILLLATRHLIYLDFIYMIFNTYEYFFITRSSAKCFPCIILYNPLKNFFNQKTSKFYCQSIYKWLSNILVYVILKMFTYVCISAKKKKPFSILFLEVLMNILFSSNICKHFVVDPVNWFTQQPFQTTISMLFF